MKNLLMSAALSVVQLPEIWPLVSTNLISEDTPNSLRLGAIVEYLENGGPPDFIKTYEWFVVQSIGIHNEKGSFVSGNQSPIFEEGSEIAPTSTPIGNRDSRFPFQGYTTLPDLSVHVIRYEETPFSWNGPDIFEPQGFSLGKGMSKILLGFKLFQDQEHTNEKYGWVELLRESTSSFDRFHFRREVVDFIPNRPIRAGFEPELPQLFTKTIEHYTELYWKSIYSTNGFMLEQTDSLNQPIAWKTVATTIGATNLFIPTTNGAVNFYRLALP